MADNRIHTSLRLKPAALEWVADLAHHFRVTRTDVIRAALAVARKHQPEVEDILKDQT